MLTNNLTNICSKISKNRMILWMAYTCYVKVLQEVEKLGRKWTYFASFNKIINVERLQKIIPISLKAFSPRLMNFRNYRRNYKLKWKWRKFFFELWKKVSKKTKRFSKITRVDEPEASVQSEETKRGNIFTRKLTCYIWKYWYRT